MYTQIRLPHRPCHFYHDSVIFSQPNSELESEVYLSQGWLVTFSVVDRATQVDDVSIVALDINQERSLDIVD